MKAKVTRRQFLKSTAQAGVLLGIVGGSTWGGGCASGKSFDLIIKSGMVVDGMADKSYQADVGIIGERIEAVGNLRRAQAKTILDATGRTVSPGFIDIHSHTGLELLINPRAESKIRQGVTTELGGNCGGSPFPLKKELQDEERRWAEKVGVEIDWVDLEGFYTRLAKNGIALNYATLVGQGTVRSRVMEQERREPTSEEMEQMKALVAQAMEQGAFGLSTGLEYTPSGFATTPEVIELCRVAAEYGGFYATHIRSEANQLLEALAEAIFIAERVGIPLQISHLKAAGKVNWWKTPMVIDLIERAQQRGLAVNADRYPYTAYSTGITIFFPQWALEGGTKRFLERIKDRELRQKMRAETVERVIGNNSWESILIVGISTEKNRPLEGKYISEAADERKKDPYEFTCDLLIEEEGNVSIVGFGMSDENTEFILKHPLVMLGSDGSALAPYGPLSEGIPHPRNYGAFPRFLGFYVRENKLLTLPEALKKITSMPAAKMGLKDRGSIQKGNFADIVIFDPQTISDQATYTDSEQYPVGIDYVIVNGKTVVDHGEHTGELPGKALKGPGTK